MGRLTADGCSRLDRGPLLAGTFDGPHAWPRAILPCLTVGLVWQFIFATNVGGILWRLLVPLIFLMAAKEELP
jgi:hypothetical protein